MAARPLSYLICEAKIKSERNDRPEPAWAYWAVSEDFVKCLLHNPCSPGNESRHLHQSQVSSAAQPHPSQERGSRVSGDVSRRLGESSSTTASLGLAECCFEA